MVYSFGHQFPGLMAEFEPNGASAVFFDDANLACVGTPLAKFDFQFSPPKLYDRSGIPPVSMAFHVPFHVVKRCSRKEIPPLDCVKQLCRIENTLIKALARAFRWKRMLESGEYATIAELAKHEAIAPSYITRVLRLTLLAPDIVENILDGKQRPKMTMAPVLKPFPAQWKLQVTLFMQT